MHHVPRCGEEGAGGDGGFTTGAFSTQDTCEEATPTRSCYARLACGCPRGVCLTEAASSSSNTSQREMVKKSHKRGEGAVGIRVSACLPRLQQCVAGQCTPIQEAMCASNDPSGSRSPSTQQHQHLQGHPSNSRLHVHSTSIELMTSAPSHPLSSSDARVHPSSATLEHRAGHLQQTGDQAEATKASDYENTTQHTSLANHYRQPGAPVHTMQSVRRHAEAVTEQENRGILFKRTTCWPKNFKPLKKYRERNWKQNIIHIIEV